LQLEWITDESFPSETASTFETSSTEPSTVSREVQTVLNPGYTFTKPAKLPKFQKAVEQHPKIHGVFGDDATKFIDQIRTVESAIVVEPSLVAEELIRFFREKPIKPFTREAVKPRDRFKEAMYLWGKRKAIGTTQQSTSE